MIHDHKPKTLSNIPDFVPKKQKNSLMSSQISSEERLEKLGLFHKARNSGTGIGIQALQAYHTKTKTPKSNIGRQTKNSSGELIDSIEEKETSKN